MLYKNFKVSIAVLCLISMLGFSSMAVAQTASGYFKQGIKAAGSGDYRAALTQFQKAKKAGLDSAALKYNFAVAYYKLKNYEQAKKAFTELTGTPKFEQIAYFNLGLVANKQKNKAAAIRWLKRAYSYKGRDGAEIKVLAADALRRLGAPVRTKRRSENQWTGSVSTSLISDSNVTLANDDLVGVASKSDTSVAFSAYGSQWLDGSKGKGTQLFLNAYLQRYSTQNQYDYNQFRVGVMHYKDISNWNMRFGGTWNETYLGGSEYQRLLSAEARARKSLSKNNQLRLRYRVSQIQSTNPVYDYLEGWRHQFRVGSRIKAGANRFRAYYQLELNDRQDYVGTGNLFTSYSPTRHTLRVTGWWDIPDAWLVRLDGRYRYSKYNDDNVLAGNVTERREDTQTRISARLSKKISKDWAFKTTYTVTNNDSNVNKKSYDRSLFSAGVTWKFQ